MRSRLLRRLLFAVLLTPLALELLGWTVLRLPVDPPRTLLLRNDIPGCRKDVRLVFDRRQVRKFGWTEGEAPAGTVRILCLGGWATFAMNQNDEDTWWGRLKTGLEAAGYKVEIAARGAERSGIVEAVNVSAPVIASLRPHLVIADFGFDDVLIHPLDYRYDAAAVAARMAQQTPPWKQKMLEWSQIARMKRWWTTRREMGAAQNTIGRTDALKRSIDEARKAVQGLPKVEGLPRPAGQDPVAEYLDGIRELHRLTKAAGATLVLTGEPSLHDSVIGLAQEESLVAYVAASVAGDRVQNPARPDPGWVEREMARYAAAAEGYAKEHGLVWIDLNGRVPRDLEHFYTDVMLTDLGAEAMAKALLPTVEPLVRASATESR